MNIQNRTTYARERGQSTVEFALTIPILLGVIVGLAAMSILFYSYVTAQLAVREGASAIVHDPLQTVDAVRTITCDAGFAFDRGQMSVKVEPPDTTFISCTSPNQGTAAPAGWVSGAPVAVTIQYTVPLPTVSIPMAQGSVELLRPISINAVSQMNID